MSSGSYDGTAWYRCVECQAVFKLKNLMIRHLKTRHSFLDRPEWELDNNDDKCAAYWERVKVEGNKITKVELPPPPLGVGTTTTYTVQEMPGGGVGLFSVTSSNPTSLVLPESVKKFKCDLCEGEMWFAFKKSLYAHLLKHHDRGVCKVPGMNLCRFCSFQADSPSGLKAHIRTHTGENEEDSRVVECAAGCGRVFSSKASMKKHLRFKCAEAKKVGIEELVEEIPKTNPHVQRQSSTDLPFKCPQCVETFPTQARLQGHLGVHSGDLYKCRYCAAPFAHVHTRGAHETNAHNDELGYGYRCPVCSKNFANIATIRGHYKYTHWLDLPPREEIESWRMEVPHSGEVEVEEEPVHFTHLTAKRIHVEPITVEFTNHDSNSHHHTLPEGSYIIHDPHSQQPIELQQVMPVQLQIHVTSEPGDGNNAPQQTIHIIPHNPDPNSSQANSYTTHVQHTHSQNNVGLRMGVGVPQVTMGALIGHLPGDFFESAIEEVKTTPLEDPSPPNENRANPKRKRKPRQSPGPGEASSPSRKKFHCRKPNCEAKFQRRWELTSHLERVHEEFSCEFCSAVPPFPSKEELNSHQLEVHHRDLGSYECRVCGKELESPRGVQEHVAQDHPESPVPLTLEARMWRKGAINRKRVQRAKGEGSGACK